MSALPPILLQNSVFEVGRKNSVSLTRIANFLLGGSLEAHISMYDALENRTVSPVCRLPLHIPVSFCFFLHETAKRVDCFSRFS
jgi:hypothetical protein